MVKFPELVEKFGGEKEGTLLTAVEYQQQKTELAAEAAARAAADAAALNAAKQYTDNLKINWR